MQKDSLWEQWSQVPIISVLQCFRWSRISILGLPVKMVKVELFISQMPFFKFCHVALCPGELVPLLSICPIILTFQSPNVYKSWISCIMRVAFDYWCQWPTFSCAKGDSSGQTVKTLVDFTFKKEINNNRPFWQCLMLRFTPSRAFKLTWALIAMWKTWTWQSGYGRSCEKG